MKRHPFLLVSVLTLSLAVSSCTGGLSDAELKAAPSEKALTKLYEQHHAVEMQAREDKKRQTGKDPKLPGPLANVEKQQCASLKNQGEWVCKVRITFKDEDRLFKRYTADELMRVQADMKARRWNLLTVH